MARLSNLEGDAGDLQTTVDTLNISKQDAITNAPVLEGQALKVGSVLNKIGTRDSTLTVETSGSIVKLAVDKTKIQEKLIPITDATTSKAVLSGTTVRSVGVDNTLNIGVTSDVINLAVDQTKIQEKLTATADATSSKAVVSGATVRSVGVITL